jgi:hypothetical protein
VSGLSLPSIVAAQTPERAISDKQRGEPGPTSLVEAAGGVGDVPHVGVNLNADHSELHGKYRDSNSLIGRNFARCLTIYEDVVKPGVGAATHPTGSAWW